MTFWNMTNESFKKNLLIVILQLDIKTIFILTNDVVYYVSDSLFKILSAMS